MVEDFTIPLNGLPSGKSFFHWRAGKEFLNSFENTDIIDADILVEAVVEKSSGYLGVDLHLDGKETVPCDRCLEDMEIDVDELILLSVKFGHQPSSESVDVGEGEREVVYISNDDPLLDLSQIVYDYIALAVPLVKTHPEGMCNPDAIRYLDRDDVKRQSQSGSPEGGNNPFAGLGALLGGNQNE